MALNSSSNFSFDPSIFKQLACPACIGALRLESRLLRCAGGGRSYPIVEGIPVLIAERAEAPSHAVSSGVASTCTPVRRME